MITDVDSLKMKVAELESSILAAHPSMAALLQDIHNALKQYPENVTLLAEEEIHVLVMGLERQTNTFLADAAPKKKVALKSTTASML